MTTTETRDIILDTRSSTPVRAFPPNLLLVSCLLLGSLPISAGTISLNFNSLPSAQGWTYVSSGLVETSVFSVDGTRLLQQTTGRGFDALAYYQMAGIPDVTQPYSIEVEAQILNEEFQPAGAFAFSGTGLNLYSLVLLGQHTAQALIPGGYAAVGVSNSTHNYLFRADPQNGTWTLDIDGFSATSGQLNNSTLPNLVIFGDGSTGVNGDVEITKFIFNQGVPEPGTWLMLASGMAIGFIRARFRARK